MIVAIDDELILQKNFSVKKKNLQGVSTVMSPVCSEY